MKLLLILTMALLLAACYRGKPSEDPPIHLNPNMDSQPKYEAQEKSTFFADGATMRQPVPGTVARGDLREDQAWYTGKNPDGSFVDGLPVEITMPNLERGRERYDIYCAPCHSRTGGEQGIIVTKGFLPPPSLHLDRLRESPDGYFYDVIANGIRNMPAYRQQIPVADRWLITAYIRALQRSQNAKLSDVPEDIRNSIN